MAQIINVDPAKKDDAFYRYKMPAIITKVEGKGNGIKTVFPNIAEVCAKLNRPTEVLNKFFGLEIGALANYHKDDNKFLVMGEHTQERIQEKVYAFITRFVLCQGCRNPETDISVYKGKKLKAKCKSCGKTSDVPSHEKVFNTMLQFYIKAEAAAPAKPKGDDADAAEKAEKAEEAVAAAAAAAATAKQVKISTDKAAVINPLPDLHEFLSSSPAPTLEAAAQKIHQIKTDCQYKDSFLVRLLMRGLLQDVKEKQLISTLQKHRELLVHFASREDAPPVFIAEALVACAGAKAAHRLPMLLKMLWEEGVVPESAIAEWFADKKPKKGVDPEFFHSAKAMCKPLVEWLGATE